MRRQLCFLLLGIVPSAVANDLEPNQQSQVEALGVTQEAGISFWEDSSWLVKPRSYYLRRDRDTNPDNIGWALGGAVEFQSGWWREHLQVAATLYTSQKLYGPSDKDGTLLFKPGAKAFTVLGEASLTWRFSANQGVRVGRQRFELPYLGSHDIRMVPNTFEALAVGNLSTTGFAYIVGYADKIKRKNDDEFIAMSEAAGAAGSNEGAAFAGARYVWPEGTVIGGTYQRTSELFDTVFLKAEFPITIDENNILSTYIQYTDQQSIGDELIGDFSTSMAAVKLELQQGPLTWRIGASTTDDDLGIQKPYGNPANYLSVIVDDFDRAGEDAWLVGASYNFQRVGPGELSSFVNIVHGDTPDNGVNLSPDETEFDWTVDYRIKEGAFNKLWLRVRGAYVDKDEDVANGDDFFDFRIIANYEFDLTD